LFVFFSCQGGRVMWLQLASVRIRFSPRGVARSVASEMQFGELFSYAVVNVRLLCSPDQRVDSG
jgi:hypothetical protein